MWVRIAGLLTLTPPADSANAEDEERSAALTRMLELPPATVGPVDTTYIFGETMIVCFIQVKK